jgi:hypothetical protein
VKRCVLALLILVSLVGWLPALAQGPDYALPARFLLPWACGQGYRLTWEPEDHWQHGKATGVAYDFSMEIGVPLYAPANGTAHFLRDDRPFETNLGHYIELVDESGDWLIRLAHLRDEQQGVRPVQAGELIGHSGISGVSSAHLHLELLVREGTRWVRPDQERLPHLFGMSRGDLTWGALITNLGCPGLLGLLGDVTSQQTVVALGEAVDLAVPVLNEGLEPLRFDLLQVALYSEAGDSVIAEAEGDWQLGGKAQMTIGISAHLPSAGPWYVGRVTYRTAEGAIGLPARGQVEVTPSPLRYVGMGVSRGALAVGDSLRLYVWVENQGDSELEVEGLFLDGLRPDGAAWRASLDDTLRFAPGEVHRVMLESDARLHQVGPWLLLRIGYQAQGRELLFAQLDRQVAVRGPQLAVDSIDLFRSADRAHVFVQVRNVGTTTADPEAIEIWGWMPHGEAFVERLQSVATLEAGQAAMMQIDIPMHGAQGLWKLVEAGYWLDGVYYCMPLPAQPAVTVAPMLLDEPYSAHPVEGLQAIRSPRADRPFPQ